jgi:hypothetical protein
MANNPAKNNEQTMGQTGKDGSRCPHCHCLKEKTETLRAGNGPGLRCNHHGDYSGSETARKNGVYVRVCPTEPQMRCVSRVADYIIVARADSDIPQAL